jgi:cytochrome c7-like protein
LKLIRGIGILACTLFTPGVSAAPFSHQIHLKLKSDCTSCHATVTHSVRVEDNNLPSPAVCRPCHASVSIPAPPKTLLAHFSHAKHLQLGNIAPLIAKAIDAGQYLSPSSDIRGRLNGTNACLACHRGMETSDAVSRANMPQMADCLVCHNKIELPFSCESCHGAGAKLRPADHPPEFLESHSRPDAKLDKATCTVCHGRRFRCLGCH